MGCAVLVEGTCQGVYRGRRWCLVGAGVRHIHDMPNTHLHLVTGSMLCKHSSLVLVCNRVWSPVHVRYLYLKCLFECVHTKYSRYF